MSHASHSPRHDAPCLLSPCDPDPVEVVRASGTSLIFLLCEHAGRAVPANLAGLGLDGADMDRHIAWDIGAAATARRRRRPRQSLSHSLARRRRACSSRSASSWAISRARNRIDRVVAPGPQGCCCCPWSATARRRACSSRLLAAVSPCGARSGVDEEVKAGCDIVGLFFLLLFSRPLPNYGSQYVRVPGTVYFNVILVRLRRLC